MEKSPYSRDYIDNTVPLPSEVVEDPQHQSRTEHVQHGITATTSHTDHPPPYQELHNSSTVGLNYPAGQTSVNYGIPPPPYSALDLRNEINRPDTHTQQEIIYPPIIVTLEEPASPCCNCCSWSCWRKTQITFAVIIFIAAFIKMMLLLVHI